ncbi:pseudouridine synthase [Hyphomicrobium sp.]|uniref:pseudouridine synthase n=1 Tax=Hyphomicrobium sp. TaxID=82 RepID=UPI002FE02558
MRKSSFRHRPPRGKPQAHRRGDRPGGGRSQSTGDAREHQSPSRTRYLLRKARVEGADATRGDEPSPRAGRLRRRPGGGERLLSHADKPGRDGGDGRRRDGSKKEGMRVRPWSAGVKRTGAAKRGGAAKHGSGHAPSVAEPMRIARAMARAGLCSRRDAERWIADGRVSVNGKVLTTPGVEIGPGARVLVDGQPLPVVEPSQLWRYNKPKGLVTTHNDPQGRPTVFDSLPPGLPRVISVGRLDVNTEGLILLTNDGALARHLELPATGWLRRYRVRAKGRVSESDLDTLKAGVEIDGVRYGPVEAAIDTVQGANMWLTVGIREGKNREVRKVLSHLGLDVNRLIRISFGPFQLLDLKPGEAEVVRRRVLADQLGPELAARFGLVDTGDPASGRRKPARPAKNKARTREGG